MSKKLITGIGVFIIILGVISSGYSESNLERKGGKNNIALGKTVAARGQFFTMGWGDGLLVDFCSLADGVFFNKGHQWDQGPIWWQESMDNIQNSLTVYLGGTYAVSQIIIQVDNNDDYLLSWEDVNLGYQEVKVIPTAGGGMDDPLLIKIKATTNAFKIEHDINGRGDDLYSVSEFQAFGKLKP